MKKLLSCLALIVATCSVQANWRLDNTASSLNFISTKNVNFAEIHQFTQLKGKLNQKGYLEVTVLLSSVDTGIPIRNTRMQEMLFDTAENPFAKLKAKLAPEVFELELGDEGDFTLDAMINLNQVDVPVKVDFRVTQLSQGRLQASTIKPLVLNASDFKLTDGLDNLRTIAGLQNISLAVPVTFDVTFTPLN